MIFELNDKNLSSAIDLCAAVAHYRVLIYADDINKTATRVCDAINAKAVSVIYPQLYVKCDPRTLFLNGSTITVVSASANIRFLVGNLILYEPEVYSEELYNNLRTRERPYMYWSEIKNG